MLLLSLLPALALLNAANAHTLFSRLFVDGQDQGNATCIRMPDDPSTATSPIASLSSTDMACGANGTIGVARVCAASSRSTLTFEYREWPNNASVGSIDISHKGPCAVYLKKVESAISDTAAGDGWFKIWEQGYDAAQGLWCTEKLILNAGYLSVALPAGLQGGYYLVRPELLALQQADKTPSDPQFYVGCAQVFLQSAATDVPQETVAIPGYVAQGQPAMTFSIWAVPLALPYPLPGPAIATLLSSPNATAAALQRQTEGLKPPACVLENANWCGVELAPYTMQAGCWNASAACWLQCTACYASVPPTGSVNCPIWEAKCTAIQQGCGDVDAIGPPDYMKVLTPPFETLSLPAAEPAQTAGDGSFQPVGTSILPVPAAVSSTMTVPVAATTPTAVLGLAFNVSMDGSCGAGKASCQDSTFGFCCSAYGWCGDSEAYCGEGCQGDWGTCTVDVGLRKRHLLMAGHGGLHGRGHGRGK